jgi:hypothetical protein
MTITPPDDLEKRIEAAARRHGLGVEDYARAVLEEAAPADREALLSEIDRVRAMTPAVAQTDSAELLRVARQERYDR